jgi:hypothetical protein
MANDNIFQQYLKPPKSVLEYGAELDEVDARKQVIQQNALSLAAGQQTRADGVRARDADNVLSRLYASGQTPDQIAVGLAQAGHGKAALAFTKQQQELAKDKAAMEHSAAQTGKLTQETGDLAYKQREEKRAKSITDIAAFTDPQQALASLALHEQAGDIAPDQAALIRQGMPQNPADFPKWQIGMLQRIMSAKDAAGQIAPDANARLQADTSTANNTATNERTAADNAANRAQSDRHFNVREAREGTAPKGQLFQSDTGPVIVDPRTGKAIPVTMNGAAVPPKGSGQKVQDAKSVIALLDLAEPLLDTATDSMLGAGADRVAAAFGQSTVGAQGAAQLRALEGALVAKQPKMSGPQSDKDVLLYRQMAGQIGDATMPVATRRAALKTVRMLNEKYAEQPTGAAAPAKPAGKPSLNDIFGK